MRPGPTQQIYWSYVNEKIVSASQRLKDELSLNCLNSSVSSRSSAVMTRPRALLYSMLFGPHEWVPVQRLTPSTGALIEEGATCDICHKEVV